MKIDVTKLTHEQLGKYYDFVESLMYTNDYRPEDCTKFYKEAHDEKHRRDKEVIELANRLRPFIQEQVEQCLSNVRTR